MQRAEEFKKGLRLRRSRVRRCMASLSTDALMNCPSQFFQFLVRPNAETFVAYSQKCTHLSCAVRPRASEGLIVCPCHDGYFDLLSGRPVAGPPRRPLARIRLDVRGDQIYATGVEARTA